MFEDLINLQQLDTSIDQLRHRRSTLPQISVIADKSAARDAAASERDAVWASLRELRAAEKEAEDHASTCEEKAAAIDASLYDGSVVAHKELESLQAERAQLMERQRAFEDTALELMEQAEPIEADLAARDAAIAALADDIDALEEELVVARAEIDAEIDAVGQERADAAAALSPDLLASYETLRSQLGGVAVARLVGGVCDGCHLQIPAVDLDRIRHTPEDTMVHCPECQRILVR